MYIRRTTIKSRRTGEPYFTYRLVESIRAAGRVRQRTVLNLGRYFEVPQDQWPAVAQRIEALVGGPAELFATQLAARWKQAAQHYAAQVIRARAGSAAARGVTAQYHNVDVESLERERDLFDREEVITHYDLTNTYLEGTAQSNANAAFGKSKEKRSDCPLVTLALVLDASGFPKRSEVFAGNAVEVRRAGAGGAEVQHQRHETMEGQLALRREHLRMQAEPGDDFRAGQSLAYALINRFKSP